MICAVPKGRTVASMDDDARIVILVVCNLQQWRRDGRQVPQMQDFHFTGFAELSRDLIEKVAPDIVLSALMGEDFDALELARCLSELGFRGRFRALTTDLPNPDSVRDDVRSAALGVDFDLFILEHKLPHGS